MDADSVIATNLRDWPVNHTAIVSCESNPWQSLVPTCTRIWASLYRTFPTTLAVSDGYVWILIFPKPGHPIVQEAMEMATQLILEWNDTLLPEFSMYERAVCLTGPGVFSVAVERRSTSQFVLDGIDYKHKALFKVEQHDELNREVKRYDSYGNDQPLKIHDAPFS